MNQPEILADSHASGPEAARVRELELELIKTQAEAKAARLEARAAELELMIRQLTQESALGETETPRVSDQRFDTPQQSAAEPKLAQRQVMESPQAAGQPNDLAPAGDSNTLFSSWDEIREAAGTIPVSHSGAVSHSGTGKQGNNHKQGNNQANDAPIPRMDAAHAGIGPRSNAATIPNFESRDHRIPEDRIPEDGVDELSDRKHSGREKESKATFSKETLPNFQMADELVTTSSPQIDSPIVPAGPKDLRDASSAGEGNDASDQEKSTREFQQVAGVEESEEDPSSGRSRPAALVASLFAHIAILLLLAAFTLTPNRPKDQVALSASTSENDEPTIETISIETAQPETSEVEPTPSETQYDLSELGEMKITELKPTDIAGPPAPPIDSPLSSQAMSAAMSMSSSSESSMQFCGVEGGGNHFVYLVDSSGSMGDAFESARTELLDSIRQLKPDQRFYVVFFDAEPDYMRLSDPNEDEPRSVTASPENKRMLQRWAMTIKMDRGKAPYDPLKFAIGLQPDVIFLLSDGEFPQGIEDLLQEINQFDNLFGDNGPISLVHTIGYHSRDGETRMKRIAKQNGGQYRHVPKP